MIEGVSLDYFKIFYEVAIEKNITKAANNLFISQPAITQTIKKLEEKLGESVFVRTNAGIFLTEFGENIFSHVSKAMFEFKKIEEYVLKHSNIESGSLCVGCGTNIAKYVLADAVEKFLNKYPKVEFGHTDSLQAEMLKQLEIGKLDLCITQKTDKPMPSFEFVKLFDEKFVFVCTKNYKQKQPKFIVQAQGSHNRKIFEEYIKQKNFDYNIMETAGYNMALTLAEKGLGIALVPHFLLAGKLNLRVFDETKSKECYGYYYNKNNFSKTAQEFTRFLPKTFDLN